MTRKYTQRSVFNVTQRIRPACATGKVNWFLFFVRKQGIVVTERRQKNSWAVYIRVSFLVAVLEGCLGLLGWSRPWHLTSTRSSLVNRYTLVPKREKKHNWAILDGPKCLSTWRRWKSHCWEQAGLQLQLSLQNHMPQVQTSGRLQPADDFCGK